MEEASSQVLDVAEHDLTPEALAVAEEAMLAAWLPAGFPHRSCFDAGGGSVTIQIEIFCKLQKCLVRHVGFYMLHS